jgi:thymidylate synthase (FAD)
MKIAQPSVDLIDYMGSDLSVVNSARVSFAKESYWKPSTAFDDRFCLDEKDIKLISYLAKHNHWSPFAHTSLQFRISAPIFVARQLVKHQVGGVWNEVSRRYVDDEPSFYFPTSFRGKPVNAKQGSSDITVDYITMVDPIVGEPWKTQTENAAFLHTEGALHFYTTLINNGVAPEQARMFLPQNTMTEWYWTGSLAFFARVCKQRLDPHAQQETREIAQMINDKIPTEFEHSWKALLS